MNDGEASEKETTTQTKLNTNLRQPNKTKNYLSRVKQSCMCSEQPP